ncbi:MAG: hypothetical protein OXF93_08555 [Acidobacteria bacterium]|nr:hypothetical protein [Acidobacteriota bacterium]
MRPPQTRHELPRGAACIAAAAALLAALPLPAATARMPLDEIRAGMTGTGITVFEGTTRERFDVHVLGVLTNAVGPRRHLIVARIEGGPLAETGVIQGMSGSPVYVDDRLIGALSYGFGAFSTEAIAGITPIEEMAATDAAAAPARTAARFPPAGPSSAPDAMLAHLGGTLLERAQPFARQPIDVRAEGLPASEAGRLGALLRPIGTPLGLSGFVPEVRDLWSDTFGAAGVVTAVTAPAGGAPQGAAAPPGASLQPGDAIGATLMSGDFTMAGTGTVTLVDEGRVYAFGHPFYNLGPAQFPMTRVRVTTLLPSRAQSTRLASVGEVLGTIDQDRATGIYGTLGPGPALVPVTVTLAADDRELRQRFAFEVVDDRVLTPLLTYTGILNTFFAWTRQVGAGTYRIDGTAYLRGRPDVAFGNVFAGDGAALGAAAAVAAPLTTLAVNRLEPVAFDRIDIAITSSAQPRTGTIERAWIDADRLRAGATVALRVALRDSEGQTTIETLRLTLPPHVNGPVQLLVADAARAGQRDLAAGDHPRSARTLPQLIRTLNGLRRNDRLYVRLIVPRRGAVVGGEPLPGLPASVLAVVQGDRAGGDVSDLHDVTVGTWEIATDRVVTGSRLLSLTVEAG